MLFYLIFLTVSTTSAQLEFIDGPYVLFNRDDGSVVNICTKITVEEYKVNGSNDGNLFLVPTDKSDTYFEVNLKGNLTDERIEYKMPSKLVAISDIEGSFKSFRKLLQKANVVDTNLNWSFGKGHLVLDGDFFDRGDMVLECLWLIYKLEEEAKQAGGHVHFILGNHETMNLQGDTRYVHPKYFYSAKALGRPLGELYAEDTELGRWLRTKNTVEKIGNLLFVHGGISGEVNNYGLNLNEINTKMRPHYDKYQKYENDTIQSLMWGKGPLWFRSYYGEEPIQEVVDATLEQFGVDHIITGHTVVADTISIHYNGKVINIDTPHAKGVGEALLIEGNKFFRVNMEGNKVPLFKNRKQTNK